VNSDFLLLFCGQIPLDIIAVSQAMDESTGFFAISEPPVSRLITRRIVGSSQRMSMFISSPFNGIDEYLVFSPFGIKRLSKMRHVPG